MGFWSSSQNAFKTFSTRCLLNGCGVWARQSSKVFERLGIRTIGQLRQWPIDTLKSRFGSQGEHLVAVGPRHRRRPCCAGTGGKVDLPRNDLRARHRLTWMCLRAWLIDLTEQVAWRLRRHGLKGRTVQLKVRFADFSLITRSQTLAEPTDITNELWQTADEMLSQSPSAQSSTNSAYWNGRQRL